MNFIFVTTLIFIILIPGFLFRLSYFTLPFSKRFLAANLISDITWSIIPSFLFHFIAALFVANHTRFSIRFDYLGYLLLSINDKAAIKEVFENIKTHLLPILYYNFSVIGGAIVLGMISRKIVRGFKLDRQYRLFRFSNKWYYILTGECLDFPHIADSFVAINFRVVDILCMVGNEAHIYIGELFDWYTDESGNLDSIHLRNPYRRKMGEDEKDPSKRYYKIPTRYLIIPYKSIVNINVRYFHVEIQDPSLTTQS